MSARTNFQKDIGPLSKVIWHPYGLQALSDEKFIEVVGKIMKGDHVLLALKAGCTNIQE